MTNLLGLEFQKEAPRLFKKMIVRISEFKIIQLLALLFQWKNLGTAAGAVLRKIYKLIMDDYLQ